MEGTDVSVLYEIQILENRITPDVSTELRIHDIQPELGAFGLAELAFLRLFCKRTFFFLHLSAEFSAETIYPLFDYLNYQV